MATTNELSLIDEWKEDSKVTLETLSNFLLNIPQLHAKYLQKRELIKSTYRQCAIAVDAYKSDLKRYFRCELNTKDELERLHRSPQHIQIPYTQMEDAFNGDQEYNDLRNKLEAIKERLETVEEILKHIDKLGYSMTNIVKWQIFINGGGGLN
jgi:hypothetical protein